MNRHLTTHDVTWFLEADRNKQLDLDPPYQRRSVWTRKDKQFFLDTIFRDYPSPAIFLHKTVDDNGRPTFHVVDGKQRIQTILDFVGGKVPMAEDYGDVRLNSRRWPDLRGESDLRTQFWNYKFVVEELGFDEPSVVNNIFDRINRNARKLTRQELRHAKYEGWFISQVESEIKAPLWKDLGVATQARESRMADSQFLSELMLVVLEGKMRGFNQDALDDAYAGYDDISTADSAVNEEDFLGSFSRTKQRMLSLEAANSVVTTHCRTLASFYTVWSALALETELPEPIEGLASQLAEFMTMVEAGRAREGAEAALEWAVIQFAENLRGASTDIGPRGARYDALLAGLRNLQG